MNVTKIVAAVLVALAAGLAGCTNDRSGMNYDSSYGHSYDSIYSSTGRG